MRIDAHHHVWDLEVRDQPWTQEMPTLRRSFAFDELAPHLDSHQMDGTVLVQTITVPEETPELLLLADETPQIAGVVGWVDLTAPDVAEQIARLRGGPGGKWLVGIRHQVQLEPDPDWLRRSDVRRGLVAVALAGLTYELLVTPPQLEAAIDTVRGLETLTFVLDHGGKPPVASGEIEPWGEAIKELGSLENCSAKLSGLVTEARLDWKTADLVPYANELIDSFGPDRIMFGSDWPVCLLAASYDDVVRAAENLTEHLSVDEQAEVFGGAAERCYGLEP